MSWIRGSLAAGAPLVTALTAMPLRSQQVPDVAVVLGQSGDWLRAGRAIQVGDLVRATDTLLLDGESPLRGHVTLVMDDDRLVRFDCRTTCPRFAVADSLKSSSIRGRASAVVSRIRRYFSRQPAGLTVAIARGEGLTVREAVIAGDTDPIDFSAAVGGAEVGQVEVELAPIASQGVVGDAGSTFRWSGGWPDDQGARAVRGRIDPGLHQLVVRLTTATGVRLEANAWVFVSADAAQIARGREALRSARTTTSRWPRASIAEVRGYWRAVLWEIASPPEPE